MEDAVANDEAASLSEIESAHARNAFEAKRTRKKALYDRGYSDEQLNHAYNPEDFLKYLEGYIHPRYCLACFSNDYSDSTMWAHYACSHSGACLIFRPESNKGELYLGNTKTAPNTKYHFRRVRYCKELKPLDVLRDLDALDRLRQQIAVPNLSPIWPESFLVNFRKTVVTKHADWQRESEYRLIWEFLNNDRSQPAEAAPNDRILEYEFDSLEGIIFGAMTSDEDQLHAMEIISRKCSEVERRDFKYFKAYINNGRIGKYEIFP